MKQLKLRKQRNVIKTSRRINSTFQNIFPFRWLVSKTLVMRDYWFEYPVIDWLLLTLIFCVGFFGFNRNFNSQAWFPTDTRRTVYQACVTISGTLLGLSVTSISVLNSLIQKFIYKVPYFRKDKDITKRISTLFFSAVKGLGFAVLVFLFALVQVNIESNWSRYIPILGVATLFFIVSRLTRMFLALSLILRIAARPEEDEETPIGTHEYPYEMKN